MATFQIKAATQQEFSIAVEWAADEGWNPGLDDLSAFHAADSNGFLLGFADGRPVSCISVVRYGESFGFLGFYIVKPEFRGHNYGLRTWQAGLEHLADRTVGLDGVVAQQDNYRKSGFVLAGRNVRYTGTIGALPDRSAVGGIQPITPTSLKDVTTYDRRFFPADRTAFTRHWACPADTKSRWGIQLVNDDTIQGFGVIRACRQGYKVGPLFADDREKAESILTALCRPLPPSAEVSIDVPEDNTEAVDLAHSIGFRANFETARMYKGQTPHLPIDQTFGITTFELG